MGGCADVLPYPELPQAHSEAHKHGRTEAPPGRTTEVRSYWGSLLGKRAAEWLVAGWLADWLHERRAYKWRMHSQRVMTDDGVARESESDAASSAERIA